MTPSKQNTLRSRSELEWYLSHEGHYLGPFAHEQICAQLTEGRIGRSQLAWRDGMSDWLPLESIEAFAAVAPQAPSRVFGAWPSDIDFVDGGAGALESEASVGETPKPEEKIAAAAAPQAEKKTLASPVELPVVPLDVSKMALPASLYSNADAWEKFFDIQKPTLTAAERREAYLKRYLGPRPYRALALIGGITATSVLVITSLQLWRSTRLPSVTDVNRSEKLELNAAIAEHLTPGAPAIAVAMSTLDTFAPYFYLATNLADGTRLDILIEGLPETLVDKLRVSVRASVTVQGGIARTPPFRQENGQPFPRGEYRISVSCSTCDGDVVSTVARGESKPKALAQKTYFLGGSKNQEYDQRLKAYHDRLRVQAQEEVTELKQIADTLEGQLKDTTREYQSTNASLRKSPQAITQARKAWTEFDHQWKHLQEQMRELFARWTPETLESLYFHSNLYGAMKSAGERVTRLHQMQAEAMSSAANHATDVAIATEADLASVELKSVREKILTVQTLPAAASGMPQRLGN